MNKLSLILFLFTVLLLTYCQNTDTAFLEKYMNQNNLKGTIIIENIDSSKKYTYNVKRSEEYYLPASTFKIINTLIALQEGVIKSEKEYIKWDGLDKGLAEWNKDQNILTAFPASCVWFYQELAKRIGNERYLYYLNKLKYGNGKTGKNIDTFWLDGDLRISAKEQIEVMKNIYFESYPFNKNYYDILKKLMIVAKSEKYIIRAKTGWTMRVNPQIGWYVGYVEIKKDVWFFACNLDINKAKDAEFRDKIVYRAFEELGIFN
jgi:beta-lactamase class D